MVQPSSELDAALGSVFGAFIGDSLGSYCEFQRQVSEEQADQAMLMPGGGPFKLPPGQITDDSEMAISCAHGLIEGHTTANAVQPLSRYRQIPQDLSLCPPVKAIASIEAAKKTCNSLSNGCLMRSTPLAIWTRNLPVEEMIKAVKLEVSITHYNQTAQLCVCAYHLIIHSLIKNFNQSNRNGLAYNEVKEFIQQYGDQELNK